MLIGRPAVVALATILGVNHAIGGEIIKCTSSDASPVTIVLASRKAFGYTLNCIEGDFIEDLTPCAPNEAYSNSYPTGEVHIREIVKRWQDVSQHSGHAYSSVSETKIVFSGGWLSQPESLWTFSIDRVTGEGRLTIDNKQKGSAYKCEKQSRKL